MVDMYCFIPVFYFQFISLQFTRNDSKFGTCPPTLLHFQISENFCLNPFPNKHRSFENTVGKGEIARNEQFLLFPVFSTCLESFLPFSSNLKLSSATLLVWTSLKFVVWERVTSSSCYSQTLFY